MKCFTTLPVSTALTLCNREGMDDAADSPAILTVFRSRLRGEATSLDYHKLADELERRARAMPEFVEFKTFAGDYDERVAIVVFDNLDITPPGREVPEHISAKQRDRDAEYQVTVAQIASADPDDGYPTSTRGGVGNCMRQ